MYHCTMSSQFPTDSLMSNIVDYDKKVREAIGSLLRHASAASCSAATQVLTAFDPTMPMETKFKFTDLTFFHQVYKGMSVVKLPSYLTGIPLNDRNRLRSNIRQPSRFNEFESSEMSNPSQRRVNRHDQFSLRCTAEGRSMSFKNGFFFRTHLEWNELPTDLKSVDDADIFVTGLKQHLWDAALPGD